jgi:putative ABC transport system permease protein
MLRLAPWRRAPFLLARRPAVALALAAAAFVAVLPAAAAPLFLSSARNATLEHQIANSCPWIVGTQAFGPLGVRGNGGYADPASVPKDLPTFVAYREAAAQRMTPPQLTDPLSTLWWTGGAQVKGGEPVSANFMTRPDFAGHVKVVAGGPGPGAWVPDRFAEVNGVRVGDTITIPARTARPRGVETAIPAVTLPVTAVYTDLRNTAFDEYWCTVRTQYEGQPGQEFGNTPIPALLLLDKETFVATAAVNSGDITHRIEYAVRDRSLPYERARETAAAVTTLRAKFAADPALGALQVTARLPSYLDRADLVRRGLLPPVLPITFAGVLVGLLVVAAAGLFWVQRRRRELTVLAAHGVGPAALGVKALAEAGPALLLGAAAGWGVAFGLVRWAGPGPVISAQALPWSVYAAGATFVVAAVLVGVAAAVRCRSLTDVVRPHGRFRPTAFPWELLVVAAGVALWFTLSDSRELASDGSGSVAQVPSRLLVVPILVIVGLAAFGSRIGARWLGRRSGRPPGRRPALFLAARRLAREAPVAALLAAATAVPIAFAGYGATVTGSVRATLAAEARMVVGADVVLGVSRPGEIPPAFAGRATPVLRVNAILVGNIQADIVAVDVDTFADAAFWDGRPAGRDLDAAMATLRDGGALAGAPVRTGSQGMVLGGEEVARVEVTQVAALPAAQGSYPIVLTTPDRLGGLARRAVPQLWVRGDPAEIRRTAVAAGLPLTRFQAADELYANTLFEPLTYTFDYLAALSLLTGLITTVGLLLYLESRAPVHRRGYALLRRMRLRPRGHLIAVAVELITPLVAGLVGGIALAAGLVAALSDEFEINTLLEPGTVIDIPGAAVAGTAAAVAVIALLAVSYAQRRVGRATPAEVLRDVS